MRLHLPTVILKLRSAAILIFAGWFLAGCGKSCRTNGVNKGEPNRVLSVCDIIADPSSYRGTLVGVRGVFTYDGLRQDDCVREFVTGDHRWPAILSLRGTDYRLEEDERPFGFATDHKSWDELVETAIRTGKQGSTVEIWATIIGQIRARSAYVLPGNRIAAGYGHLGVLPAELVVKRIADIQVKPVPESRYDYRLPKARAF